MNLICTYAMDLLEFMALQVFEGNTRDSNVFADEEEEEAGEIIDPND